MHAYINSMHVYIKLLSQENELNIDFVRSRMMQWHSVSINTFSLTFKFRNRFLKYQLILYVEICCLKYLG